MLSSAEAEAMQSMDGCLAVTHQLDTTHSPEFLDLSGPSGVWSNYSTYGQDIIVGLRAKASAMMALDPFLPDGKALVKSGRTSVRLTATGKSSELDTTSKATKNSLTRSRNTNLLEKVLGMGHTWLLLLRELR
ncbi:hypothetical protein SUGI_0574850 [Cryptomeria japonica]|nr:hypothetical protein SUGI_0574850 [Cryptomeria japonica]